MFALRDYQEDAINDVRNAFSLHHAVLLVLATGAGKTVCFTEIASLAAQRNNRVLVLAHRDTLIKQASGKMDAYGVRHGIIMAGFTPDPTALVQVGSVQTLVRRLESKFCDMWEPRLIIIDEAHLSAAKSYQRILARWPKAKILGVTGSPIRLDGKPLGKKAGGTFDYMVKGISIGELIERGYLSNPIVYAPREQLDLSGIRSLGGEYRDDDLEKLVDKPKLIGSAVEYYKKVAMGIPAVAWCVTLNHARHVRDRFIEAGIPAEMLCGEDSTERREEVLGKLARREILVVTFVGLLVEGVDVPEIGCVILLRPTKSTSAYLQTVGRGLRVLPGKNTCIILDHASLTYTHGFVDDERDWVLDYDEDSGPKGKRKTKAKTIAAVHCDTCHAIVAPQPVCPVCGSPLAATGRKIDEVDGELVQLSKEDKKKIQVKRRKEVEQTKTLEDLLMIENARGYSDGWARHTFNTRLQTRRKYVNGGK